MAIVANRSRSEWQELDRQHYLHPFTDHKDLGEKKSRIITRADGVYIYDADGNEILDGMSGLWCVNIGYGRDELVDAAEKQLRELQTAESASRLGDSAAQLRDSGSGTIAGLAAAHGLDGGVRDRLGSGEIGLADLEVDHVAARRFQRARARQHLESGLGSELPSAIFRMSTT